MKILKGAGRLGAALIILVIAGTFGSHGEIRAQEMQLPSEGKVVGQVIDKELKPVVGWPVNIRGVAGILEGKHTVAFTDAEGTYEAFLPPGRYAVRAVNRPEAEGQNFEVKKGHRLVRADQIMFDVKVAEGK